MKKIHCTVHESTAWSEQTKLFSAFLQQRLIGKLQQWLHYTTPHKYIIQMLHASNLLAPTCSINDTTTAIHKTVFVTPSSGATHPTHARAGTQPSLLATRCMPGPMHTISSQLGGQSSGIIYTLGHNIRNPANQMETAISNSAHDDDHNDNRIQKLSILLLPMTTCAANDNMCNVAYTQVMVSNKKKKTNHHAQLPHNKMSWNLNTQCTVSNA